MKGFPVEHARFHAQDVARSRFGHRTQRGGGRILSWSSAAACRVRSVDPANGARAAAIDPDAIRVCLPVDWDSVDPIPPQLAAILAAPGPVDVPLDDVVPGEPAPAHAPVA